MSRNHSSLRRRSLDRAVRPRILIVCEGERTEPQYFEALKSHRRLSGSDVEVCGEECGSHPRSVVAYAVELMQDAARSPEPYEQVWCVFDRDEHQRLHEALDRARDNGIHVALSNPCFELWYLLHYEGKWSYDERDAVVSLLKRHIPEYSKACAVYGRILPFQESAMQRAEQGRSRHVAAGLPEHENPSTCVDRLVRVLNEMAGG